MCEQALYEIAPDVGKYSKFGCQWGTLFEYMDTSMSKPIPELSCTIPEGNYKKTSYNKNKIIKNNIYCSPSRFKLKIKNGKLFKAMESFPKIYDNCSPQSFAVNNKEKNKPLFPLLSRSIM